MRAEVSYDGSQLVITLNEMSPTECGMIQREVWGKTFRAVGWNGTDLRLEEEPCPTKSK